MSTRLIVPLLFSLLSGAAAAQETAAERARRDADNPLKRIIEAGKIKPRQKAGDPTPAARIPERVQARIVPAVEAAPVPAVAATVEPVVAPPPVVVAPPAAEPAAPRSEPESRVSEVVVPAPVPPVPAPAPVVVLAPLKAVSVVEPRLPRRLLDKVRGDVEVVVTFTVGTDGSVGQAAVQSSSNALVNPTVLEAIAQWRYAPIPQAREHAVQLVMRAAE
jgi:TonB family protein